MPDSESDHLHCAENEEIIECSVLCGTFMLEDGPVDIYGYKVKCRVCGEEYLVAVG